jgi:hypothetical protein
MERHWDRVTTRRFLLEKTVLADSMKEDSGLEPP